MQQRPLRTIRSFVRRKGRLSPEQEYALEELMPVHGLIWSVQQPREFGQRFSTPLPKIVEIGFGLGHSLVELAKANPTHHYIGIEVHQAGLANVLLEIVENSLKNLTVIQGDATEILEKTFEDDSLSAVYIFFPDPWPKRRHQKRRLIQAPFVHTLTQKLKTNGILHLATDWQDYAEQMMAVLSACPQLQNTMNDKEFSPRPAYRSLTRFESRGIRLGYGVWDLVFVRK